MLFCVLCLLIACSADEQIQSARLMDASAYYCRNIQELIVSPLPLNGRGIIAHSDTIALVFDKPVRQVSINDVDARPNQVPTATVWLFEIKPLEVWAREMGANPEKDVTLTITYEDDTGIHKDTLDVTLRVYAEPVSPLVISFADPSNNEINVDANRLNREGIKIGFDKQMDTQRTRIVVYNRFPNPVAFERGQRILHWEID